MLIRRLILVAATITCGSHAQVLALDSTSSGTPFYNLAGVVIPENSLRFADSGWVRGRDHGYALALQRKTNHYYLWIQSPGGVPIGRQLYCDGELLDRMGKSVAVDTISTFAVGDLLGKGSNFLIADHYAGKRLLGWNLADCKREGKLTATAESVISPYETTEDPLLGDLLAADFDGTGRDLIQIINPITAELSQWSLAAGEFRLARRTFLTISATSKSRIADIKYVGTTRLPHDSENIAYEAATIILHDKGFTLMRNGTAVSFAPNCIYQPSTCSHKTLLFNLDQGFTDGLQDVARKDRKMAGEAIDRIVRTLKLLQEHFDVWALINPIQQERDASLFVLDRLASGGIPFVLDYYSSDVTALAATKKRILDYNPRAFSPLKGLSLDIDGSALDSNSVNFFNKRYGNRFVGLRFMERLGIDLNARNPRGQPMMDNVGNSNRELVFDWHVARRALEWTRDFNKFVIWADPALYLPYACYMTPSERIMDSHARDEYLSREEQLASRFPNLLPMYDNNEGLKYCGVDYGDWLTTPRNFRLVGWERIPAMIASRKSGATQLTGTKGFGLSVQSWTADYDPILTAQTLPASEIVIWTLDAFAKGASIVEFEPYFYFFSGSERAVRHSSTIDSNQRIGDPRSPLSELLYNLGITIH